MNFLTFETMEPYILSAACIFCYMCILFVLAQWKSDNGLADIGWGLGFVLVACVTLCVFGDKRMHQKAVTFLVTIWGIRLATYLIIRNWGKPEDFRYANWRKAWGKNVVWRSFLQVFMLQGAIMFLNVLPVIVVNSDDGIQLSYKYLYPLGCVVWFIGFFFESVGDWQMYNFKNDRHPHRKRVMDTGLWKYTRHPNYFGEALIWWGIFILAIPSGLWYISILAPLAITYLLLKVSGVTMLEKKYEGDDEYSLYKMKTNAFFPWLPKNHFN